MFGGENSVSEHAKKGEKRMKEMFDKNSKMSKRFCFYAALVLILCLVGAAPVSAENLNLDIKANDSDGPITVLPSDPVSIQISLDPGEQAGVNAEWWIVAQTPFGMFWNYYSYIYPTGWTPGINQCIEMPLSAIASTNVLNTTTLPIGEYEFFFAVDDQINNIPEGKWVDSVKVTVEETINTVNVTDYYPISKYSNIYIKWSDLSNYNRKDVVSYTNNAGVTHYYEVIEIPDGDLEWLAAAYLAQQAGGYLVCPETEDENEFVFSLIDNPDYWFTWDETHNYVTSGTPIGGFQEDSDETEADSAAGWMWLSGEKMDFTNWSQNLDDGVLDSDPRNNTQPNDAVGGYIQDAMFYGELTARVPTWGDFPVRFGDIEGGEGGTYYAFVIEYNSKP